MTDSTDLDHIAKEVRTAAEECDAMVLDAIVSSETLTAVAVGGATFPALVKHLRPRLIYMKLLTFDANEDVATFFDLEGSDLDSGLKKFAAKWKARTGQSSRLILGVMADGIMHGIVESTDWFDEFEEEAEALSETREEERNAAFQREIDAEARNREAEEKKRLAPYVKKLVGDVRFVAPKISLAKRMTLAETLFPDLDRTERKKAVERAVSELWLTGSDK